MHAKAAGRDSRTAAVELEVVLAEGVPTRSCQSRAHCPRRRGRNRDKLTHVLLLMLPVFDSEKLVGEPKARREARGPRKQEVLQEPVVGVERERLDDERDL